MDSTRFDSIAKTFSARRSRRSAIKGAAGVGATVLGATIGRSALAQDATPSASPATLGDDGSFLFVQTATSGSFTPNPNAGTPVANGTPVASGGADYLLTLEGHTGGTIYFSDRPERIFGDAPTQKFLDGLGFSPNNPPNAAIVTHGDDGTEDVLVVELLNPAYDEAAGSLTYGVTVLSDYSGEGLAYVAAQQQDSQLAATFGRTSLFIDDCSNANPLDCYNGCYTKAVGNLGERGMCWSWSDLGCKPCSGGWSGTADECNSQFSACNGKCFTEGGNCNAGT